MSSFVQSGRLLLRVLPAVLLIAVFNLSCGNKSKPTEPDQPGGTAVGVLLQGNATDNGVDATINLPPTPAPESDITESHFMKSRLDAALNLTATVGEINTALNAAGAKIISMTHGMPLVTLVIPSVETKVEADSIGDILEGSGAFLFARGTFTSALSRLPGGSNESAVLPPTGVNHLAALSRIRMPAAWNLKGMATLANAVTAVVPDEYFSKTVHPDIPGQIFLPGGGRISNIADQDGFYTGNHGFNTCGIMGAAFDDVGTAGVHPGPKELLAIQSLTIGGISVRESSEELASRIPEGNCVVNTSYGFYGDFTDTPRLDRILEALYFRIQLAQRSRIGTYLHVAAANNEGLNSDDSHYAAFGSPFNLASSFDQPSEMIPADSLTGSDLARFNLLLSSYITTYPNLLTRLQNVIVVGSSDSTGLESTFSNTGSLVRVLGEAVPGPCVKEDANSNPNYCKLSSGSFLAKYDGTSMAAPQIAGLAAYLWNIKPDLTIEQMKAIMYRQFSTSPAVNGFVDAFGCVLALDDNLANANVRKRLVDVAGSDGGAGEDGVFNEKDLLLLYNKFKEFENLRLNSGTVDKDYSRYDLNGDGYTGDSILQIAFDLDVNSPAAWSTITGEVCGESHSYDELQVSDYDVARYYANTALYTGDQTIRDSLTGCVGSRVELLDVDGNMGVGGFVRDWSNPSNLWDSGAGEPDPGMPFDAPWDATYEITSPPFCDSTGSRAHGRADVHAFAERALQTNNIVNLTIEVASASETIPNNDSSCATGSVSAMSYLDILFEVKNGSVPFTFAASASTNNGFCIGEAVKVRLFSQSRNVFEFISSGGAQTLNDGISGILEEGRYFLTADTKGDAGCSSSASVMLTFFPAAAASQKSVVVKQR